MPHYHHAELFGSPVSSDCPLEHTSHSGHHRDQGADQHVPLSHCHAFNNVTLDKFNPSVHPPVSVQMKFLGDLDRSMDEFPAEDPGILPDYLKPPGNIHLIKGLRILRAPPSIG